MNRRKRITALMLALVMLAGFGTTMLIAASRDWRNPELGALSQYYETGNSADPGRISTVEGDSGGTSYGLYMFVEKTVASFMDWLKRSDSAVYRSFGDTLYNAYAYNTAGQYYPGFGTNFKNTWQAVARQNPTEFAAAQKEFWQDECYTSLLTNLRVLVPSFDVNNYSIALQNVLWSRSVHHGVGVTSGASSSDGKSGATGVVWRAFQSLGGFNNQSETEIIAAIYRECSKLDPVGKYLEGNMETLTATKYGIKGRSLAYFSANGGGVQTAVYSRLHVNEPSDAIVMRYANMNPAVPEGKYTITYIVNGQQTHGIAAGKTELVKAAEATQLKLTYYANGCYTLTDDTGARLTVSGGKLALRSPSASNDQFWTLVSSNNGYLLYNVGAKVYLTAAAASTEIPDPGTSVIDPAQREKRAADILAAVNGEEGYTLDDAALARYNELLEAEISSLTEEHLKTVTATEAELNEKLNRYVEVAEAIDTADESMTEEQFQQLWTEYMALFEYFTGKKLEDVMADVAGKLADEQLAAEKAAEPAPTVTVNTYTVGTGTDSTKAAVWALNKAAGKDAWSIDGLFYPGLTETDASGNKITHHLTEGNSSFPIRGVVTCTQGIRSITVEVRSTSGSATTFSVTGNGSGTWFDLWTLDERCTFSKLAQGSYTLTITGTNNNNESTVLLSAPLTVGAKDSSAPAIIAKEEYTVTFVDGDKKTTKVYKLGDTYGKLPDVSGEGFKGWFTADGKEVFANSIVAAEDHTVTAQYGQLYTVTFKSEGGTVRTGKLAEGSVITAPANPVKAADSKYVYSFKAWVNEADSSDVFVAGKTYMPAKDVTYVATFTQTANSGGNTGGNTGGNIPAPSGSYLTGIVPNTSVSALTSGGYTVYSGGTQVTSGLVGTGMTAVSNGVSVTIVVTGDVSGDGKLTITDVVKLQKSVVGSASLTGAYAKAADINHDGYITITDVVQAAQVTVGKRTIN